MEVTHFPIGKLTRGNHHSWTAVLLQIGSSSASLIGKSSLRKTHNNDHSDLLISGIQSLLQEEDCFSLSILVHWMHGYIIDEEIALQGDKHIHELALPEELLKFEEDVRYTIFRYFTTDK